MNPSLPDYYNDFLTALKLRGTSQSALVKELCILLNLQNRAIYNRLNGETQFTINEAILICKTYNIDLQEIIMPDAESITYNSSTVGRKISKPLDYLQGLTQSFDWLETLSNPKIHYTSHDFPLFLTCAFPNIIKLKLAIWSYYSWELKSFRSASILDLEDKEFDGVNELCKKIVNQYSRVPSVEYLPSSLFENTLYQIRYLWEIQDSFIKSIVNY